MYVFSYLSFCLETESYKGSQDNFSFTESTGSYSGGKGGRNWQRGGLQHTEDNVPRGATEPTNYYGSEAVRVVVGQTLFIEDEWHGGSLSRLHYDSGFTLFGNTWSWTYERNHNNHSRGSSIEKTTWTRGGGKAYWGKHTFVTEGLSTGHDHSPYNFPKEQHILEFSKTPSSRFRRLNES
jgi:hypothetical protein